jgi:hypothetical protein
MIRLVSYAAILDDPNWPNLLREYGEECSIPELGTPNPQRDIYEALEKSGGFYAFAGYDEYQLVAAAAILVYTLPHYGTKIAASESMFLSRSNRTMFSGLKMMNVMELYARSMGCVSFLWSAPVGSRFARLLTSLKDYRHTNNAYVRQL